VLPEAVGVQGVDEATRMAGTLASAARAAGTLASAVGVEKVLAMAEYRVGGEMAPVGGDWGVELSHLYCVSIRVIPNPLSFF
jgi:hypothetical protein